MTQNLKQTKNKTKWYSKNIHKFINWIAEQLNMTIIWNWYSYLIAKIEEVAY